MATHLKSSAAKKPPQQKTRQQRLKQQIFSMSCQLFYITRRMKFGHTRSSTQEAARPYFSRRQLMNYAFRKKHVNNFSWKEPTERTRKHVTQHQQKFQIWKTTNATTSNKFVVENINWPKLMEHPGDIAKKYDYLRQDSMPTLDNLQVTVCLDKTTLT